MPQPTSSQSISLLWRSSTGCTGYGSGQLHECMVGQGIGVGYGTTTKSQ